MQEFKYSGFTRLGIIWSQLFGVLGLMITTSMVAIFVLGAITMDVDSPRIPILDDPRATFLCFALCFFVIGGTISFSLINSLPTLWVNEEGIYISVFIFWRIFVTWSDIIEVRREFKPGYSLVMANRVTIFHRFYGWLYSHTIFPSFLITKNISNYGILMGEITTRVKRIR